MSQNEMQWYIHGTHLASVERRLIDREFPHSVVQLSANLKTEFKYFLGEKMLVWCSVKKKSFAHIKWENCIAGCNDLACVKVSKITTGPEKVYGNELFSKLMP